MSKPMRLSTARYSNPNVAGSGLVPVGITRYPPRFPLAYELKANLYDLAATSTMLARWRATRDDSQFTAEYLDRLNRLGADEVVRQVRCVAGDAAVLLCYEDLTLTEGGVWCHRRMLADWLTKACGMVIEELPDPGKKAAKRSSRAMS